MYIKFLVMYWDSLKLLLTEHLQFSHLALVHHRVKNHRTDDTSLLWETYWNHKCHLLSLSATNGSVSTQSEVICPSSDLTRKINVQRRSFSDRGKLHSVRAMRVQFISSHWLKAPLQHKPEDEYRMVQLAELWNTLPHTWKTLVTKGYVTKLLLSQAFILQPFQHLHPFSIRTTIS